VRYGYSDFFDRFASALEKRNVAAKWKRIEAADKDALMAEEKVLFRKAADSVKASSGAARHLARSILVEKRLAPVAILKGSDGAPIWPYAITGSLSHTPKFAFAAIASSTQFKGIGIDIEEFEVFPAELATLIMTKSECRRYGLAAACRLFSIKEACYKACYHCDRVFFSFQDIEVDLDTSTAVTSYGRRISYIWAEDEYVAAFAELSGP